MYVIEVANPDVPDGIECGFTETTTPWYSLTADNPTIVYGTDSSNTMSSVTLTFTGKTSDTTYVSSVYYQMYNYGNDRLTPNPIFVLSGSIDSFNYSLANLAYTDSGDYNMVASFCYDFELQQYQATTTLTLEHELISLPPLPPPPLSLSLSLSLSLFL